MSVCYECCLFFGRCLYDGPIPPPEESYRVCVCVCVCVCVSDLVLSRNLNSEPPRRGLGCSAVFASIVNP